MGILLSFRKDTKSLMVFFKDNEILCNQIDTVQRIWHFCLHPQTIIKDTEN